MITRTRLTCPHCGAVSEQDMPEHVEVMVLHCPGCGRRVDQGEAHCVFCAHADSACPLAQRGLSCCGENECGGDGD